MKKRKIKVVVTGGAGFIGSHLVDLLVQKGFDVHVIDNLSHGKKDRVNKLARLHVKDVTNIRDIQPVMKGARYVFHLAALPRVQFSIENPAEAHTTNVRGTFNVLLAAHKAGVQRVIYSASSSAYGDQKKMPLKESMQPNPKSPYGLQKYIGELYCKIWSDVYGLETVCLRYFNVYGPRQNPSGAYALVIGKFMQQVAQGEKMTITGAGTQTRDFTHVHDIVRANFLAMKSKKVGKGEVINIGAGRNQSVIRIADLVGGERTFIPARFEPMHTLADNSLAKNLLGWTPKVMIEKGIGQLKDLPCLCGSGERFKKCHGK